MGILGDLSRMRTTDPAKPPAAGNDKSVEDVPVRASKQRVGPEWEKVPETEAVSASHPPSSPGLLPTIGPEQKQMGDTEKNGGRLQDLPLRSANERTPSQEEWSPSRNTRAGGVAVEPTDSGWVSRKGADKGEKKAADEPAARSIRGGLGGGSTSDWELEQAGGPPRRADQRGKQAPKRTSGLWAAVVLLALALAGVSAYGYLTMHQNGMALSQLPGIQQLVGTLQGRMDATEGKLRDLTANWASVSEQVAALNSKMRSSLQNARKHTEELIMQEQERIEAEMAKRDQAINARLAQVESEQQAQNERLAQVQDWIQKNVDGVRQEVATEREDRGRDLKALRQDVDQNRGDLQGLTQKVDRQRVDFELAKNKQQDLVPGISLTVTRTDARYQRFEGYLELIEDSRTVWLSKVAAQQAVPFYLKRGGQPYDLVVTTVTRDGVVGYLLVPRDKGLETGDAASGALTPGAQRSSGAF